jgi:large subunit ribosomal protein L30
MAAKLRVTQVKSTISHIARNRATVRALGLKGIGSTVEVTDNDATRGMVRQVRFLVTVEEVPDGGQPTAKRTARAAASTDDRGDASSASRSEESETQENA